ncbi:MAG: hypothetical protein J5507_03290 [Clostridia bacterium]|nr:hypothetical protein [Clostridia bacterium]
MKRRIFAKNFLKRIWMFLGLAVGVLIGTFIQSGTMQEAIFKVLVTLALGIIISCIYGTVGVNTEQII